MSSKITAARPLILASRSPRRQELLRNAGIAFRVDASSVNEVMREGELPEGFARRMACEKACAVAARSAPGCLVLGADTVVTLGGQLLGKPLDAADAARMLRLLSGVTHRVITGFCLVSSPACVRALDHETTYVTFRPLTEEEIQSYVASGEPMDKAGAYGIQGLASRFVTRIEGCYFNVVGLPVARVWQAIQEVDSDQS